jgi:integrase
MTGSIAKRPSGHWRARYRDEAGKEHARHFVRKVDAQSWLDTVTASLVRGDYVAPSAGDESVQVFAERWLAMQPLRASSSYNYRSHLTRHVYPAFGSRKLSGVQPSDVQSWVKRLELGDPSRKVRPLAPSTIGVVHAIFFSLMAAAVLDRKIKTNPCESTKLPKDAKDRQVVPMSTEQVRTVELGMPPELRAMIVLGAGTGIRQSEALGLTVDRVDFLRKALRVDRQLIAVPGEPARLGPPKTRASVRTIPLPSVVVDVLAEHLATYAVHETGELAGLIFTRTWPLPDGSTIREPWTRQRFGHVWRPVARAAGLAPGTGFHALRHYYASLLIRHGESVKTVQARLGHASATETLDTYSHLWPDSDDRTRDAVDSVLGLRADSVRTHEGPL